MGFSVICPYFLVFTAKLAIFLMFTVLEKKYGSILRTFNGRIFKNI